MAQIFVSHSQKDKDLIHFLLEAFAGTKVKPHLEELEKEVPSGVTAGKIEQDIQKSNAVFVLLSENVEHLKHTRDWVNWECGVAKNKTIWILEPFDSLGKISIVVPHFNHYVRFKTDDGWRQYLRSVIESYDDSHILPTLAATSGGGALLNEKDRAKGATGGFLVGLLLLSIRSASRPSFGIPVRCWKCFSNYGVHLVEGQGEFRCPTCNAYSVIGPEYSQNSGNLAL